MGKAQQGPVCHIVADAPGAFDAFEPVEGDLLIAADGGYANCLARGLQPDLLVGDFDSLAGGRPANADCPVIELAQMKDDTDLMVALREGLARGYRAFAVHAALGGDVGHTVAAIHCLAWLLEQGAFGVLYGGGQAAFLVTSQDGEVHLRDFGIPLHAMEGDDLASGTRVSVFASGGEARGVCEKGLVWELTDATMRPQDHFGVSNAVAATDPCVSVREGMLLVIVG